MPIPRRPAEVLHDGEWLPADLLHAYRDRHGRWHAVVEYTVRPGEKYHHARPQGEVRRRELG